MDNTKKPLSRLLLLIILMSGLCLPALANCSEIKGVYAPSAPEFTAEFVDAPYYVITTYETDPYTGEKVVDRQGYIVENKSLVVTIKNQAFVSSVNGTKYYMYYNVEYRGHFGGGWEGADFREEFTMEEFLSDGFPRASDSDYTVLYFRANKYPDNGQLDVIVQARIGYEAVIQVTDYDGGGAMWFPVGSHDEDGVIFDATSDWSEIQTITINTNKKPTQPNFTITEELDLLNIILIGVLILIPLFACLGLLIYLQRKHSVK